MSPEEAVGRLGTILAAATMASVNDGDTVSNSLAMTFMLGISMARSHPEWASGLLMADATPPEEQGGVAATLDSIVRLLPLEMEAAR